MAFDICICADRCFLWVISIKKQGKYKKIVLQFPFSVSLDLLSFFKKNIHILEEHQERFSIYMLYIKMEFEL